MYSTNTGLCYLNEEIVKTFLDEEHKKAEMDGAEFTRICTEAFLKSKADGIKFSLTEQYHKMADLRIPVSAEEGKFIYLIAKSINAKRIIEFGTSYGISAIYLASALKDNGEGTVITTEFVKDKAAIAKRNLEMLKLDKYVDILVGDALETLKDLKGTVDMVLLDGSKELYLDILKLVLPNLRKNGVIIADNVGLEKLQPFLREYLEFIGDKNNGFESAMLPYSGGLQYCIKM